jgi:uncharacterized protein
VDAPNPSQHQGNCDANYQAAFRQDWQHLHDPHVRALAWMLTAPNLLSDQSVQWGERIASLQIPDRDALNQWLLELERDPHTFHEALNLTTQRRLGHYAENLLRFYLRHRGDLVAHNLQVHDGKHKTIGEFDFLLKTDGGLLHWELATKFYLLQAQHPQHANANDYLGPNLADSLGAKMQKIIQQQLALSSHPAALSVLPEQVVKAQALVKGWLFYRLGAPQIVIQGIAQQHCLGYWCTVAEFLKLQADYVQILPRRLWLAPAQCLPDQTIERAALINEIQLSFERDSSPVLVATMSSDGDYLNETERYMVVPDDWAARAAQVIR